MKNVKKSLIFLLLPALLIFLTSGHHFETDLAKQYPKMDLTDLFVFESNVPNKTVFLLDANPKSQKDSSNFASNGIYKFHIGSNKAFTEGQTFSFTFKDNKVQFYWDGKPENELGKTGTLIAEGAINRILELNNGIKIWTGTTQDNFQGNAVGSELFKHKMLDEGIYDLSTYDIGEKGNYFGIGKTAVIAFEVPNELLSENIFYYASTSLEEEPNHWHQVNHIANVLFPHYYMGYDDKLRSKYGSQGAVVDEEVKQSIIKNLTHYVTIAKIQKDPKAYVEKLMERIYPDIVPYQVGTKASYAIDKFNGRPLHEDAMNVTIGLLVGSPTPLDDQVSVKPERYQANFPFTIPIDNEYVNASQKSIKIDIENPIGTQNESTAANDATKTSSNNWIYYIIGGLLVLLLIYFLTRKKK
jgi:LPXTG-motif cell wall-anchored protein